METLVCEKCSSSWKRQPSRGRKPRLCPTCISSSDQSISLSKAIQTPSVQLKTQSQCDSTKFPAPTKWKCHTCGVALKVEIGINYPPTHRCQKRLKRTLPLELISKK